MFKTYTATLSGNKIELPEELFDRHPKITELVLFMDKVKINIPVSTIHVGFNHIIVPIDSATQRIPVEITALLPETIETANDTYYVDVRDTLPAFKLRLASVFTDMSKHYLHILHATPNAILAGGFIRAKVDGTSSKDTDVFFENQQDYEHTGSYLATQSNSYFELDTGEDSKQRNTRTFKSIQDGELINLVGFNYCKSPIDLLESFDFDCVAAAFKNGKLYHSTKFYTAADAKFISLRTVINPYRTQYRVEKYLKVYGYTLKSNFLANFVDLANKKKFSEIWLQYGDFHS